ncbi:L-lactate dehydrogenase [Longibacter salinarum]|uniref:L-lactate dehydrogenase n=1 Tax=Longibacter salinarum TaxID=1850348 RepID=A0A2A8CVW5_9BACT|nr:L-lactate dehydrogenase [Longibacter salinarum]PEN12734.1 L-lactate dehydrogenase [Longibacter salinarum]
MIQRRTVGIVGTGQVGTAAAYAIYNQNLASELLLVDANQEKAEGEAMDLMHGQLLVGRVTCRAVDYDALSDAQVIIIAAGANQASPDESRLELLKRNSDIFRQIISEVDKHAPNAILLIATNPVDVLTYISQELSARPQERIIGTGTLLDTARFRALLGNHYGVDPKSVHAYILGEHGDSEVPIWSNAMIGGQAIQNETVLGRPWDQATMDALFDEARNAAYEIIRRKGYTDSAIGVVIARILRAILEDQRAVMPVSVRPNGAYGIHDVALSTPCVVGIEGVAEHVSPQLTSKEEAALRASADALRESREGLEI